MSKKCENCKFFNTERCRLCIDKKKFELKKGFFPSKKPKKSKRMGGVFEYNNTVNNNTFFDNSHTISRNTVNSGAGEEEKGDEMILGLVNAVEELKTSTIKKARGKESFAIKKLWLEKLKKETPKNFDFHYLKFAFFEEDDESYVVIENNQMMSLLSQLAELRKEVKELNEKLDEEDK